MNKKLNRLLKLDFFVPIFIRLAGLKVKLTKGAGINRGDLLLYESVNFLCKEFKVKVVDKMSEANVCLLFPGGNTGSLYRHESEIRSSIIEEAKEFKTECWLLPQSFYDSSDNETLEYCTRIFIREKESRKFAPKRAELCPDLALGYQFEISEPTEEEALILRQDDENIYKTKRKDIIIEDFSCTGSVSSYIENSMKYRKILTDRLHVCICSLAAGRDVTFIEGSYHKNRSMYETWLKDLGCKFMSRETFLKGNII